MIAMEFSNDKTATEASKANWPGVESAWPKKPKLSVDKSSLTTSSTLQGGLLLKVTDKDDEEIGH